MCCMQMCISWQENRNNLFGAEHAMVAVGVHLKTERPLLQGVLLGKGSGLLHCQHVHAIDPHPCTPIVPAR